MAYYARPEEILYHTHLSQNMLMGAKIALLPGDPGRVQSLAEAMGPAVELVSHREYTSYLAQVASQPILVISTGMVVLQRQFVLRNWSVLALSGSFA